MVAFSNTGLRRFYVMQHRQLSPLMQSIWTCSSEQVCLVLSHLKDILEFRLANMKPHSCIFINYYNFCAKQK